jgi:hypothetical protein
VAEEHGQDDIEPVIVRKSNLNENLAQEMKGAGIQCVFAGFKGYHK